MWTKQGLLCNAASKTIFLFDLFDTTVITEGGLKIVDLWRYKSKAFQASLDVTAWLFLKFTL